MTQAIEELCRKFQNLDHEWNKKNHDCKDCLRRVEEITSALTKCSFLPDNESEASRRELHIARNTLEIAIMLASEIQDIPAFEHYMSQLKCYYYDYKGVIPDSPYKYEFLGLNLLFLLSQRRLADFHIELERLTIEEITSSVYINHPVSMEQYLMEGNFHKVFLSKGNVPSKRYDYFIDIFLNATRDEVAYCIEDAYEILSLKDATPMLFFKSDEETRLFGEKRKWKSVNDTFHFPKSKKRTDDVIPSAHVTRVMLEYTKELDQII
ncbi:26S proteasome non-ATPase regulatory subunit 8 isoform 3 [Schistosoma japonicum]|uniref:26S proteasome non-ATPase regulatory subunit 8 n=1 Tax=Schistosoma japonicum TaxID=6182 RepID=A0A4Z2DD52_SCHJA|nr:26S proteasome non-ATPase regulatory subunit 8 [Schistosoma japonicum]TNN14442.1 26S proteasome non-ATPase regulatory subunit 8 isoform 3 [Schistosoma japonicum]TNN14443.1 26S proteasome non-ATPase regulatory subunit 8 isoform 3 [Schistosoma japonicum]